MCEGNRLVDADVAAIPLPHEADHGALRELEAAEEGAACAIDRPIGVAVAAALALRKLAQELILAGLDLECARIESLDGWRWCVRAAGDDEQRHSKGSDDPSHPDVWHEFRLSFHPPGKGHACHAFRPEVRES